MKRKVKRAPENAPLARSATRRVRRAESIGSAVKGKACYKTGCVSEWRSMQRAGIPMGERTVKRCQQCGRYACGIHAIGRVSWHPRGSSRRLQSVCFEPAICNECERVMLSALQRARRALESA